jgi:hypothetical protein
VGGLGCAYFQGMRVYIYIFIYVYVCVCVLRAKVHIHIRSARGGCVGGLDARIFKVCVCVRVCVCE